MNYQDRYYFMTVGQEHHVECIEKCPILNDKVMIGSVACQGCKNIIAIDTIDTYGPSWIYCQKLNDFKTQNQQVKDTPVRDSEV